MAVTEALPSTTTKPITTQSLVSSSFEPIDDIMKSAPTQVVDVDIAMSTISAPLATDEIVLEVSAPDKGSIDFVVGKLLAGCAFLYSINKPRGDEKHFTLFITSLIGELQPIRIVKALQKQDRRLSYYIDGNFVAAL